MGMYLPVIGFFYWFSSFKYSHIFIESLIHCILPAFNFSHKKDAVHLNFEH